MLPGPRDKNAEQHEDADNTDDDEREKEKTALEIFIHENCSRQK